MPEVETLARKLRRTVLGKRVAEVRLSGLPLRKPVAPDFASTLRSRIIRRIERRGKYLIVEMEPKTYWLIHLGMSGRLLYGTEPVAAAKHRHALIRFSDSTYLEYLDHRRFGLLAVYTVPSLDLVPEMQSLGPDPLSAAFSANSFWPMLRKSEREIKSFLLDQSKVAGLGNIYVCESLFAAGIHPSRRCNTLNSCEAERLVGAVKAVLKAAIRHKGTTFSDFMDSDGRAGENQKYLMVFQREGEDCRNCRAPVRKMRQSNRSSFYCSQCQV